jgi:hypothetical protein
MPISSTTVTVTTTTSLLIPEARGRRMVVFSNETGHKLHVGGADVIAGTGIPIGTGERLIIQQQHENDSTPEQAWYGRVDASSGPCIVTYATEDSTN